MKYIKTRTDEGFEEIFLFSELIHHDAFAEVSSRIKNKTTGRWESIYRQVVSAGFVSPNLICHGYSETLNLNSDPKDTELLHKQLGFNLDVKTNLS